MVQTGVCRDVRYKGKLRVDLRRWMSIRSQGTFSSVSEWFMILEDARITIPSSLSQPMSELRAKTVDQKAIK